MSSFKKTIKSTLECIRYPFLYPRNRFTGLHYNNWKMRDFHTSNYEKAHGTLYAHVVKNSEYNRQLTLRTETPDFTIATLYENGKVGVIITKKALTIFGSMFYGKHERIQILDKEGKGVNSFSIGFDCNHDGKLYIVVPDHIETEKNLFIIPYLKNIWLAAAIKIVDFIHDYPLQWVHCLTAYTEWDAMREMKGWNNAFGDKLLKEMKAQLKKDNMLYDFRITQIKEKHGTLRIYTGPSSREMFEILSRYEDLSYHTCFECGKPAKYITSGYELPLCEECFKKEEELRRKRYENPDLKLTPLAVLDGDGKWKYNEEYDY